MHQHTKIVLLRSQTPVRVAFGGGATPPKVALERGKAPVKAKVGGGTAPPRLALKRTAAAKARRPKKTK